MGMRSNLLSLSFKSTRFGKLRMLSSHCSALILFRGSQLLSNKTRKKDKNIYRKNVKKNQNNDRYIRYVIFLFDSRERGKKRKKNQTKQQKMQRWHKESKESIHRITANVLNGNKNQKRKQENNE